MGCDIHVIAEIRQPDGSWTAVTERIFKNDCWEEGMSECSENDETGEEVYYFGPMTSAPYHGRNYNLFAMLAGVRGGFARQITPVRGVPEDASSEWLKDVEQSGSDYHTHSWVTVRELIDFPYWHEVAFIGPDYDDPVFEKRFEMSRRKISKLIEQGIEAPWRTMETLNPPEKPITYAQISNWFYRETIPALLELGEPEDVRIVYAFDN